jgi:hypothetical protein
VIIPLKLTRAAEFKNGIKFRACVDAEEKPVKEWEADGQATETKLELDPKQAKLGSGLHQLHIFAQTSGKIRRVRSDEVAAFEAEAKTAPEEKKKQLEERLKLRDLSAIFSSPIIPLNLTAPRSDLSATK